MEKPEVPVADAPAELTDENEDLEPGSSGPAAGAPAKRSLASLIPVAASFLLVVGLGLWVLSIQSGRPVTPAPTPVPTATRPAPSGSVVPTPARGAPFTNREWPLVVV